jgi:hypothetical protein
MPPRFANMRRTQRTGLWQRVGAQAAYRTEHQAVAALAPGAVGGNLARAA